MTSTYLHPATLPGYAPWARVFTELTPPPAPSPVSPATMNLLLSRSSPRGQAAAGAQALATDLLAQAMAKVCELTCQVQGRAGDRQVNGARTGLSINQGLFGHGSAVIVTR